MPLKIFDMSKFLCNMNLKIVNAYIIDIWKFRIRMPEIFWNNECGAYSVFMSIILRWKIQKLKIVNFMNI